MLPFVSGYRYLPIFLLQTWYYRRKGASTYLRCLPMEEGYGGGGALSRNERTNGHCILSSTCCIYCMIPYIGDHPPAIQSQWKPILDRMEFDSKRMLRVFLAEFLGTLLLVMFGDAAIVQVRKGLLRMGARQSDESQLATVNLTNNMELSVGP